MTWGEQGSKKVKKILLLCALILLLRCSEKESDIASTLNVYIGMRDTEIIKVFGTGYRTQIVNDDDQIISYEKNMYESKRTIHSGMYPDGVSLLNEYDRIEFYTSNEIIVSWIGIKSER